MLSALKTAFGRTFVTTQKTSAFRSAAVVVQCTSTRRDLNSARKPRPASRDPPDGLAGLLSAFATPSFGTFGTFADNTESSDSSGPALSDFSDADRGYFGTGSWRF